MGSGLSERGNTANEEEFFSSPRLPELLEEFNAAMAPEIATVFEEGAEPEEGRGMSDIVNSVRAVPR